MERAEVIDPGFSTADADYPKISMDAGDLVLRFKDWQEANREVFFTNAVAFRWQEIESFIEGERYDSSHVIAQSAWLQENIKQGVIGPLDGYKHYKFNFNENGQLDVICSGFEI